MDARSRARWEKTRAIGRLRFVWQYGVLGWGGITGVLFAVFFQVVMRGAVGFPYEGFMPLLAVSLVLFMACGYVWGRIVWAISEAQYQQGAP